MPSNRTAVTRSAALDDVSQTSAEAQLQVVILEDNPSDAELIELELSRNGLIAQCTLAVSAAEFIAVLKLGEPDLVLADYTLPGFDGMTALRQFREMHPDAPFIFVSGSLGEERAIEALKNGATDYVLKDRLQRLPAVVRRALDEHRAHKERRIARAELEAQRNLLTAIIDNLPEHIYAVDSNSRLTVINRSMLMRLKRKRTLTIGRRLSELPGQEHAREMELQDAMVLNSGNALFEQEHAVESCDGSVHWLISSRIPLRNQDGAIIGVVCTERDNTVRKELEQEILDISNREQRRLGSDLHDGLGQELTGLSLMMKGLEVQMEREQSPYLPQVAKLSELIAHTIQNTRSLARGLAPVNLERGGIRAALKQLAARCSDIYGLNCTLDDHHADMVTLDESLATHVYRIAQEATTNAARHAEARNICIELRTTARRLHLSITDDGIGLNNKSSAEKSNSQSRFGHPVSQPGIGLKIMEYRARTIGGHITFETLKQGTRVTLSCPLQLLNKRGSKAKQRADTSDNLSAGQQSG
jgi:two-component system, NarL family, sensor histidine kinase UhpB